MVRTKADNCASKAVAAKAPRKVLASSGGTCSANITSPGGKTNKYAGGNVVCKRPTPDWQKGIGGFLSKSNKENCDVEGSPDGAEHETTPQKELSSQECSSQQLSRGSSSSDIAPQNDDDEPCSSTALQRNGLIDSDEDD